MSRLPLEWTVGYSPDVLRAPQEMVRASVPGAVQADWAATHGWPDWWYGDNFKEYRWMEDRYWTYRAQPSLPTTTVGQRLVLVLEGVDYHCVIKVNGQKQYEQEGMFTPIQLDLSAHAGMAPCIEVVILPPPKMPLPPGEKPGSRWEANSTCKPPIGYGWDWHPRLIPSGLWRPAYVEIVPAAAITATDFTCELSDNLDVGRISACATVCGADGCTVTLRLFDTDGAETAHACATVTAGHARCELELPHPRLWWCRDMGEPHRYTVQWRLSAPDGTVIDTVEKKCGFRRVQLVMHPGQWERETATPTTQTPPPITLELNGRPLFCRGSNWVPPHVFPGAITEETCRALVTLAVEAHFNLLRCWGGAIVNSEAFFDICDELGIMVWQEFPLSCMSYEPTPRYLAVLRQEAMSIVHLVRSHPCLAIWCGGNELFCHWSKSTMQNRALRLLDSLCLEFDPCTPFIPTSPLTGMRHGWYMFRSLDGTQDIFEISNAGDATAYTEFGCCGASPADYIRSFIPPQELFPPSWDTAWQTHHGQGAFGPGGMGWLDTPTLEHYFGSSHSLEEMVERSEWLQFEGYKAAFEEYRRQKPRCSMALNWDYNEPWPSAAGNNLINWPDKPKPAYYAVQQACRPQMLSVRIPRFDWVVGQELPLEVWLLNDRYEAAGPVDVTLVVTSDTTVLHSQTVHIDAAGENRHSKGPAIIVNLAQAQPGALIVRLDCAGRPEWSSTYRLLVR